MNASDIFIPMQPIDSLDCWITRTLAKCSSFTSYISEHVHNHLDDLSEMHGCMYHTSELDPELFMAFGSHTNPTH